MIKKRLKLFQHWISKLLWEKLMFFLLFCPCSQILLGWIVENLSPSSHEQTDWVECVLCVLEHRYTHIQGHGKGRHCGFSLLNSLMIIHVCVTLGGPMDGKHITTGLIQRHCWNIASLGVRCCIYIIWIIMILRFASLHCVQVIHTINTVSFSVLL